MAIVDAVGIGLGLAILGIPLAVSLAALVFLGTFIPIIGAVLAGGIAVLVALVAKALIPALLLLGVVIAVMQLENHLLQPPLLGRAVNLHPLAVVLAIAAGLLAVGALLAVLNAATRSLRSDPDEHLDPTTSTPADPEPEGPPD